MPNNPPGTSIVGWVTGPDSPNQTIQRFAITGTDLGIMWDNGDPANHQVLMAFGDTNGYCGIPGKQWRYNALMRSQDGALSKTVAVPDGVVGNRYSGSPVWRPGISKQIINSIGQAPEETGIIPTAGVAVGRTQYLNFMSIRDWDSPAHGRRTSRRSRCRRTTARPGASTPAPSARPRRATRTSRWARSSSPDPAIPTSTRSGRRTGAAVRHYVARVAPNLIPDLSKYEYWNADNQTWVPANPAAATPVIPGPVGEMSAQYNTYLKQYLVMYGNGANDVVMRTAPAPQGPWSPEQLLVPSMQIPGGIYAPYLHPWSTGKELYYNLSLWSAYNVMLMHTVLA